MKHIFIVLFLFCIVISSKVYPQTKSAFSIDNEILAKNKKIIKSGSNAELTKAYDKLLAEANLVLSKPLPTIVNKNLTKFSIDKHDYVSLATYWWPDPNKKDGLPYIPIDGKVNPEVKSIKDYNNLVKIATYIKILGFAYYYSEDEKYVEKASFLLRTWFINPQTKMNPNLNHAQFIKGVNDGRIEGTIETRFFVDLIDGLQLLANSTKFKQEDYKNIQKWFSDYLYWLENSDIGIKGFKLKNNIATSYHMQRISYCLFLNKKNEVLNIQENNIKSLLKIQFEKDGKQTLEVKRSSPWNYSVANLEYWMKINEMLKKVRVNIIDQKINNSYPLKNAFNYLDKYENNISSWEYKQKSGVDTDFYKKTKNIYYNSIQKKPSSSRKTNSKTKNVNMTVEDAINLLVTK